MLPLFRLGLGGKLGSGRQWWPVVSLSDTVRAYRFLLESDASGPYNVVAVPVRNADFTAALAEALHRPAVLPVPRFALHAVLGEFAGSILGSLRAVPQRLTAAGFTFADADVRAVVRSALAD
jgi:NAD dependent epimerase/dehydratase family enzyme